jgi:hypothetical protein
MRAGFWVLDFSRIAIDCICGGIVQNIQRLINCIYTVGKKLQEKGKIKGEILPLNN